MSRKSARNPDRITDHAREFDKVMESIGGGRFQRWQVFSDFTEMSALSLSNAIIGNEDREKRYLDIVKRYERKDLDKFTDLFAIVTLALEGNPQDFLGAAFQRLELANHWHGQFFTPYEVCRMMARMTISPEEVKRLIEENGYVSVHEPACGSAAMVIAIAEAFLSEEYGLNPQDCLFAQVIDVDSTAAQMAMIQLSLLGIPAEVIVGNTLTLEMRDRMLTPMWYLGHWWTKRRLRPELQQIETVQVIESDVVVPTIEEQRGQMFLFGEAD